MGTPLDCGMDRAVLESLEPRQLLSAADLVGDLLFAHNYWEVEDFGSKTAVELNFRIKNVGDADAGGPGTGGFYLAFYWSSDDTQGEGDQFIPLGLREQDDGYSAADPNRYHFADVLTAGTSSDELLVTIPVPEDCPFQSSNDGFILMVVDALEDVPETYEWNNTGRGLWRDAEYVAWDCLPEFADLCGIGLSVTEQSAGECTAGFSLMNQGTAAAGAFDVAFFWCDEPYLSPAALPVAIDPEDPNYDPQHPNVYHASGLDSWDYLNDSVGILLPEADPFQTTGRFHLVMVTDYGEGGGQVAEASEANNHSSFTGLDTTTSAEWDNLSCPHVTECYPNGRVAPGVGYVTFVFDELMDPLSFALSDVASFTGPSGDLTGAISGFDWISDHILKISFSSQQKELGAYSLIIGPDIRDSARFARPMDQDQDGTGGEAPDDLFTAAFQVLLPEWTVMVYLDGDNELERYAIEAANLMEKGLLDAGGNLGRSLGSINVVVQFDRMPGYDGTNGNWTDTRRGIIVADSDDGNILSELGPLSGPGGSEANMGDPDTLRDFIEWAVGDFAAQRYALILWDHGAALSGCCRDDTDKGDRLSLVEVREALMGANQHMDLIGSCCCDMGILEQAIEVAELGDVIVASESPIYVPGWTFDMFLADLGAEPHMTADELACAIVATFPYSGSGNSLETISAFRLSGLAEGPDSLVAELNDLVAAIMMQATEDDFDRLANHWDWTTSFSDPTMRDLGEFLQFIAADGLLTPAVRAAGQAAEAAYMAARIANYAGVDYPFATGLAVYFQFPGDAPRADYAALAPSLCAASLWDEFLGWWVMGPVPRVVQWVRQNWPARPTELVIQYAFSQDVGASIGEEDFIVYNRFNQQTYQVPSGALAYDSQTFMATLDLRNAGLAPGWYSITIDAYGVTGGDGDPLDGDGDGIGGDDHVIANLMVPLGGDADLNGSVDVLDYLTMKANYGKTGMTWADGDFNYDGTVNRADMLIMKPNFGQSIGT